MEIKAVEKDREVSGAGIRNKEPQAKSSLAKKCKYLAGTDCVAPSAWFEICKTCPYGYIYCFGAVVKNLYQKTVGLAINILLRDRDINRIQ